MDARTYQKVPGSFDDQRGADSLSALARIVANTPEQREAYYALLGGLRRNAAGNSILVTSLQPNEGKTTVASCLAITASLAGHSVLLVEADLRRPWLASDAGIDDPCGLGEFLGGWIEFDEAIHTIDPFADAPHGRSISVMTAGARPPALLPEVNWPEARTRFRAATKRFDIVILDSPPIAPAGDVLLLAGLADGVLLVVRGAGADREEVRRAKEQLHKVGTPLIGAVLNHCDAGIHGRPSPPNPDDYRGVRR